MHLGYFNCHTNESVRVITTDARLFEGILEGLIIPQISSLSSCYEHIIYEEEDEENQAYRWAFHFAEVKREACRRPVVMLFTKMKGTLKGTKTHYKNLSSELLKEATQKLH